MKKRLLGIVIAVTMMMCAIPMTVSAELGAPIQFAGREADKSEFIIESGNRAQDHRYTVKNIKIQYYGENGESLVDYNNAASAVITLENSSITIENNSTEKDFDGIYSSLPITIELVGNNNNITITGTHERDYGIFSTEGIVFTGDGSLKISNEAVDGYGIGATRITFDSTTVDVSGKLCGIKADEVGVINFNGSSKVNVKATDETAIYAKEEIFFHLTEGGKVSASSNQYAVAAGSANTIELGTNNVITLPTNGRVLTIGNAQAIADADGNPAKEATVEYVVKKGADTSDSSELALFAIMGVLALCGAGFAYKRREN